MTRLTASVRRPSTAEYVFQLLLRVYPPGFRAAFGREMTLLFRDQRREAGSAKFRFWAGVIWDVARSAPFIRAEAWRARWAGAARPFEGKVRTIAILSILIGVLEMMNAFAEASAASTRTHDAHWLSAVALVLGAGMLLIATGIALLRPLEGAILLARVASVLCLVGFVGARLVHPWMSILAQLLGICFPAALLFFLLWPSNRTPSAPLVG